MDKKLSVIILQKKSKVYTGPYAARILITGRRRTYSLKYLSCDYQSDPCTGGYWGGFSLMVNLMCPSRLALCPFWWFLFLHGVFHHLGYLLALVSQTLSNVEILEGSDPEGSIDFFWPIELPVTHRPNPSENFRSCTLDWWLFFRIFLSLCSLFFQGIFEILRRTALRLKRFTRKSCPCLRIFVSLWRRSLGMASLLSRWACSDGCLSLFCEGR